MKLWNAPGRSALLPPNTLVWPVNRVWEVFGAAKKDESLAEGFRARLNQGAQPTRGALRRYAEYLVEGEGHTLLATKLVRQTRLNPVTRKIISLMNAIDSSSWRGEFHAAALFAILNEHKYPRLVARFWKRMCDRRLDCDSETWAQSGLAMVNRHQYRMGRDLLRDWRTRRGVPMWSLANYVQCLSRFRRRELEEVIATCRDSLADLPHDHCAHYLACMQAEALALVGDKEGLLVVWQDRRAYFDGGLKMGEYFRAGQTHLLYDIPDMIRALQSEDRKAYRKLLWRLRFQRLWNQNRRTVLRFTAGIIILLLAIAMAVGVFRQ